MCSLLGKESLPAEGSPQQNKTMELLGNTETLVCAHTCAHASAEYTRVKHLHSHFRARQGKKYKICPNMHLPVTAFRGLSWDDDTAVHSQLSWLGCLTSILPPKLRNPDSCWDSGGSRPKQHAGRIKAANSFHLSANLKF